MVGMRNVCVRLALALVATVAMVVAGVMPATAQTVVDPTTAEFQPSADHSVTSDGIPLVTSYLLRFFPAGSSTPSHSMDIGKPAPDPDGLIRFRFTSELPTPLVPGITYEARVSAVGPGGSAASLVSNPFTGPPPCTFAINPTSRNNAAAAGESISVAVTAGVGCNWPATSSPVTWIVATPGVPASGNGTVNLNVLANTATTPRNATVTIAGQPFIVTQVGACAFAINPTSRNNVAAGGEAISVAVTAGSSCNWPATTSPVSWIVITSAGSGSGNGTVTLNVTANTATTQRNATVTIAGRAFMVTQVGACSYTVTPPSLSVPADGAASSFSIGTTAGCSWAATGMPSWITIPSGQQTGPGTLSYTIAANTGAARSVTLTIAGKPVLVSQGANTPPAPPSNLRIVRSGVP